ncbi:hypothetical protein ABIF68_005056 [Bradyrhizobium japonicum]
MPDQHGNPGGRGDSREPLNWIAGIEWNEDSSGRHACQHSDRLPGRAAQYPSDGFLLRDQRADRLGQGQDAGQQLRVREAVIAVADCDPVAELRRHRNQVFDGGDAGKAGFQGIE